MLTKSRGFSSQELARFKELQQRSFAILESVAASLEEGVTERSVARKLVQRYRDAGFSSFFHLPVVLFGDRTALPGNWSIGSFFPRDRVLAAGDSVVLDASPIAKGYLVDTSYSFCFGENALHREMMQNLAGFRTSICDAVNRGERFKVIADQVLQRFKELGYDPAHSKHPGEVLGHRAVKFLNLPFTWRLQGFDGVALSWFKAKDSLARKGLGISPLWNGYPSSDHASSPGLWLVEPHAGKDGVGAKWEEILVVDSGGAYWLDDAPPHVRQWRALAVGQSYGPVPPTLA